MPFSWTDLLAAVSVVMALTAVAGMGLQNGRVSNLRNTRDDQEKEITRLRDKVSTLESDRVKDKAEIAQLNTDILAISRVVTGEVHWQAISEELDVHHKAAEVHWSQTLELCHQILEALILRGGRS